MKKQETEVREMSEVLLRLFSYCYLLAGGLLLVSPERFVTNLIEAVGHPMMVMTLHLLGAAYTLLGLILFSVRKVKGKVLSQLLLALLFIACISFYTTFRITEVFPIKWTYFLFEGARIILIMVALYRLSSHRKEIK